MSDVLVLEVLVLGVVLMVPLALLLAFENTSMSMSDDLLELEAKVEAEE